MGLGEHDIASGFQEGQVRPAGLRSVLTQEPWAGNMRCSLSDHY